MVEIPNGVPQDEVGLWDITPERLERINEINERHRARIEAMKLAQPLFEQLEDGTEVRGKFVEFIEDLGGGLRPMYETLDGTRFFVSPFYDPGCEEGGDDTGDVNGD